MIELDEAEWAARRMRYAQLKAAVPDLDQQMEDVARVRAEGTPEFQEILETFIRSGDAAELRFAMDSWSKRHRTFGFGGANGQMLLNQLPGRLNANPQQKNIVAAHAVVPCMLMRGRMPQHVV